MKKRKKVEPSLKQLQEMQDTMGPDSPEFKAILRDFATDKSRLENSLDNYFIRHERAFDRRNPQFKSPGRSPQSIDDAPMASNMAPPNYGGITTSPYLTVLGKSDVLKGLGTAGAVGAGMLIPSSIGRDPGEDFLGKLNQQAATLGGPAINPREIDAMIAESMAPPSPAPEKEYYSAMEPEFEPMIQKVKTKTSTTKSAKTQKPVAVEKMAEEYTVRPASPAFQQGVQNWAGQGQEMDIDPEILINEMTSSGSPMRRGSFPKRKRKNPGMRVTE